MTPELLHFVEFTLANKAKLSPIFYEKSVDIAHQQLKEKYQAFLKEYYLLEEDILLPPASITNIDHISDLKEFFDEIKILNNSCFEIYSNRLPIDSIRGSKNIVNLLYKSKKLNLSNVVHIQEINKALKEMIDKADKNTIEISHIDKLIHEKFAIGLLRPIVKIKIDETELANIKVDFKENAPKTKKDQAIFITKAIKRLETENCYISNVSLAKANDYIFDHHNHLREVFTQVMSVIFPLILITIFYVGGWIFITRPYLNNPVISSFWPFLWQAVVALGLIFISNIGYTKLLQQTKELQINVIISYVAIVLYAPMFFISLISLSLVYAILYTSLYLLLMLWLNFYLIENYMLRTEENLYLRYFHQFIVTLIVFFVAIHHADLWLLTTIFFILVFLMNLILLPILEDM
jgi:hypothetical protein